MKHSSITGMYIIKYKQMSTQNLFKWRILIKYKEEMNIPSKMNSGNIKTLPLQPKKSVALTT